MRLALVIASDYQQSAQLPTLSRSLEDADRFAAYLDGSDLDIGIEELSADRHFSEQFEEALREPGAPLSELIVYFAGYVVTAPGRDPSLILDGDRLGAFALPRLRRLVEETARRALVVIDAVAVAHDGATPEEVAEAIGSSLGRHGALSVLVNVSASGDAAFANAGVGTSFTDLLAFCWDTALKSDASETELSGLDVFELMRAEAAFDAFPAARYFPGRVDFDWAAGGRESDHEISGLRSTSDEDLLGPGNGFDASFPQGSPLPSFSAHHSAPVAPPASGMPRGALASPFPAPPEALRAAAASVTFSNVPALHVPPPPPRSAPPPPPPPARSVPPPLPSSSLPPPPQSVFPPPHAVPPAHAVPPPLPAWSTPPPPLPAALPPPLPARSVPPPVPTRSVPPPLPPLPPLHASLADQEEELTEPGQPFAAMADDAGHETFAVEVFEGETHAPTLINHVNHGGFGDAEDTEVTTASGSSRALEAHDVFAPTENPAGASAPQADLAEAVTSSDAALSELLALDVTPPEVSLAPPLPPPSAATEWSPGTAASLADLALSAPPPVTELTREESLSIEALLADTLPSGTSGVAGALEAPEQVAPSEVAGHEAELSGAAGHEAEPSEAARDEAEPSEAAWDEAAPAGVAADEAEPSEAARDEAAPAGVAADEAEPSEAVRDETAPSGVAADEVASTEVVAHAAAPTAIVSGEPGTVTAVDLSTPSVGRRTLPSDFVTSVLEEAGVVMDGATAETAPAALPSVLPPDLVPRT
ncbi:MAG TPA: hypothetical protein VI197_09725, partial [Polyangiaceae bacterium]